MKGARNCGVAGARIFDRDHKVALLRPKRRQQQCRLARAKARKPIGALNIGDSARKIGVIKARSVRYLARCGARRDHARKPHRFGDRDRRERQEKAGIGHRFEEPKKTAGA
jgi:hypothetical protein